VVSGNAGETTDARVSTVTVKTIAVYMLTIIPWFYRLGGQQENDFLAVVRHTCGQLSALLAARCRAGTDHH
jgi:hypothetical protein